MWIIGHTALAYLAIKLIYIYNKEEIYPRLLILIFIFANILDSTHIGIFRAFTHNIIGAILYSSFWILFFLKLDLVKKKEIFILYIVVLTHAIGDYLCSSFNFLSPFENYILIWNFNSLEHIVFSFIISSLFLIVFIISKDFNKLGKFFADKKEEIQYISLFNINLRIKSILSGLFTIYYLFACIQFFIFFTIYFSDYGLGGPIYMTIFFSIFILYLIIFTVLFFKIIS